MKKNICISAVLVTISSICMAEDNKQLPFPGTVTGNVGVLSSYDLRGMTNSPENDKATVQAGFEYSHPTGFYLGYWGSTLGYSLKDYDTATKKYTGSNSFENDFSIGYRGKINEDLGYTVGGTYYYYAQSDAKSDFFETLLGVNYKRLALTAQTATKNSSTTNKGDTYLLAAYSHPLPSEFTANVAVGAYYYDKDKNLTTTEDFTFRHLNLGLSHPLGTTGANMSLDFIVGGYDREDKKQKNKVVAGLKYTF